MKSSLGLRVWFDQMATHPQTSPKKFDALINIMYAIFFTEFQNIYRFLEDTPKYDDYRFYHWPGIDIFIYFSHEYITIPTIQWINAAHKHGVKVLGTIIFEYTPGRNKLEELLLSTESLRNAAEGLVLLAQLCGFEGWFFNVECSLAEERISLLKNLVSYLTDRIHQEIPNGEVIWYDSITRSGNLAWQNELNHSNKMFFDACDGIFLNYTWQMPHLMRTRQLLKAGGDAAEKRQFDVFVGLDVFGRGQVAKFLSDEVGFF